MRPIFATTLLPLMLAACVPNVGPQPEPLPMPPVAVDACGAGALAPYIGRPVAELPATGPWAALRVIKPGMMVTMDYSASRMDAEVDNSGVILRLSCG